LRIAFRAHASIFPIAHDLMTLPVTLPPELPVPAASRKVPHHFAAILRDVRRFF
jgi:hypothetical protein